jgi:hypothetical protein
VIVDGVQKARPGIRVNPTRAPADGAAPPKADGPTQEKPAGNK